MVSSKQITTITFGALSLVVLVIFLSASIALKKQLYSIDRLATLDVNGNIQYFINFNKLSDSTYHFPMSLSSDPNIFYKNKKKGVYFFNIKSKENKLNLIKKIGKLKLEALNFNIYSNSKKTLQEFNAKIKVKNINGYHFIPNKKICFLNNCFTNVVGIHLQTKKSLKEKDLLLSQTGGDDA
ncbi:MAG: hypothetical protein CME61_02095 [Halobacteriovoraceae bacterium]|nr:hypothetical protein [Halobacteriovoraceae bacterium]